jgi:hypothetical protein
LGDPDIRKFSRQGHGLRKGWCLEGRPGWYWEDAAATGSHERGGFAVGTPTAGRWETDWDIDADHFGINAIFEYRLEVGSLKGATETGFIELDPDPASPIGAHARDRHPSGR